MESGVGAVPAALLDEELRVARPGPATSCASTRFVVRAGLEAAVESGVGAVPAALIDLRRGWRDQRLKSLVPAHVWTSTDVTRFVVRAGLEAAVEERRRCCAHGTT